jgi:hypothetical protein
MATNKKAPAKAPGPEARWTPQICTGLLCHSVRILKASEGVRVRSLTYSGRRSSESWAWYHRVCYGVGSK